MARILGRSPGAVSNWRKSGIPASIERKAIEMLKERNIYVEDKETAPLVKEPQLSPETQIIIEEMEKLTPEQRRRKLRTFLADLDEL